MATRALCDLPVIKIANNWTFHIFWLIYTLLLIFLNLLLISVFRFSLYITLEFRTRLPFSLSWNTSLLEIFVPINWIFFYIVVPIVFLTTNDAILNLSHLSIYFFFISKGTRNWTCTVSISFFNGTKSHSSADSRQLPICPLSP